LRNPEIVQRVGTIVRVIKDIIQAIEGQPQQEILPNHRVLLAAYMLAYVSEHVFDSGMGERETAVKTSAEQLLPVFESFIVALKTARVYGDIPVELVTNYHALLRTYLAAFHPWKANDEARLCNRLHSTLLILYSVLAAIAEDDDTAQRAQIQAEIDRLREKLAKVGGANMLARFDEERIANPPELAESGQFAMFPFRMMLHGVTNESLVFGVLIDPNFELGEANLTQAPSVQVHNSGVLQVLNDIFHNLRKFVSGVDKEELAQLQVAHTVETLEDDAARMQHFTRLYGIIRGLAQKHDFDFEPKWQVLRAAMEGATAELSAHAVLDIAKFLQECMSRVQVAEANCFIRLVAPSLTADNTGIEYLRKKLDNHLGAGGNLKDTTMWLSKHMQGPTALHRQGFGQLLLDNPTALDGFVRAALVGFITEGGEVPELLINAVHWTSKLTAEFKRLVDCATVMRVIAIHVIQDPTRLEEIQPQSFNMLSDMVLAHSPSDPAQVTQLYYCIEQTCPWIPEEVRQPMLQQMLEQLDPEYDMRVIT
jgi:hypothetical protein